MQPKNPQYGLTAAQVEESRRLHGENILTPPATTPLWKQFLEKFEDPIIRILLIALLASLSIACVEFFGDGHTKGDATVFFEPLGIFFAVILATGIGFLFEVRANKAFDLLNSANDEEPVRVLRDGHVTEIPKKDVVVGDVLILAAGDEIAADGLLFEAVSLNVNESTLTGEPVVRKSVDEAEFESEATYPTNYVLRGTTVVEGHGRMVVEHVGDATENGKVFVAAQIDNSTRTPLNDQLDRLGKVITRISYVLALLILVGRTISYFHDWHNDVFDAMNFVAYMLQSIMLAVTLIVVAVPEGLPMSVTLSLALSMRRMLKTNNLVRRMHACETMGAATVICTDKTGTLTQNQMRTHEVVLFGEDASVAVKEDKTLRIVAEGIATNSTAFLDRSAAERPTVVGNPTEGALLLWMDERGFDYEQIRAASPQTEQLTFSTERKYMATVVQSEVFGGKRVLYVKGAPEIVLGLSAEVAAGESREAINERLLRYQNQAMRTLGFAYQVLEDGEYPIDEGKCVARRLTFQGVAAIADPVRADVPDAVKTCLNAGIGVKIVTGDTPGTAREIARQIGLWDDAKDGAAHQVSGVEIAAMSDEELVDRAPYFKVISRARPMDKKRLVEALQYRGEVVAVTGDGTNDAPALKAAHVGLSMGDGTSVAKEASDITILGNSFSSITQSILWGRSLYKNIQRFILFQMTINVAACLIVLIGAFFGTESPLTVTQMLWVNLIMDTFAAMALASLPPSADVMQEKPRRREAFIINRPMWQGILGMGVLFTALLFGLMLFFDTHHVTQLSDPSLWNVVPATAEAVRWERMYEESMFFTIFVFLQFWNMFNARAFATGHSAFAQNAGTGGFWLIALVILLGQILIVTLGGVMFNVVPLSAADWCIIIATTSTVLWAGELKRLIWK